MRPDLVVVGAGLFVLGAAFIAVSPIYASSGFYKEEFQFMQSGPSSANNTGAQQTFVNIQNQRVVLAITGSAIAAVGGGVLACGITKKAEGTVGSQVSAPVR